MKKLNSIFYNFKFDKNLTLPKKNDNKIIEIKECLNNLPALKIIKNKKLLDDTIKLVSKFSVGKKNFVVLGTGGSNLGARALINILQGHQKNKIFFYDNIDPIYFNNSLNKINLYNTGFIIISKSGSTPETISQFASIIEIFDKEKNTDILYKNCLIITEDRDSPLNNIAKKNKCLILNHEKNIGGRYSVFSNVGMVPAILAGLNVKKIHSGALKQYESILNLDFIKLSYFFKYQKINNKISNSVIMTYSDGLKYFGRWYLQLWAESIGKNNRGITPLHAIGTTDQHSQMQLYLDGPKDKFFTFITTNHKNKGLRLHQKTIKDNNLNYLIKKNMGDLMHAEQDATIETFRKNNFLFRKIHLNQINEFTIGQLMMLSIIETISTCIYLDIDPFNQPAVEQSKELTKKYLL